MGLTLITICFALKKSSMLIYKLTAIDHILNISAHTSCRKCLRSNLQTSPPTPQNLYPNLKIQPFVRANIAPSRQKKPLPPFPLLTGCCQLGHEDSGGKEV